MLALEELLISMAASAEKMSRYGVQDSFDSVLKDNEGTIEDLQAEQMFSGKRADSSDILPSYAESTKKRKRRKGQPVDRVTLRDTKDFHDSIESRYDSSNFAYFVSSPISYAKYLTANYRSDIFGLNDTFLNGFYVLIKDDAINEVLKTFRNI